MYRAKQAKWLCACGCGNQVSTSGECQHLAGAGPKQFAAHMLEEHNFFLRKDPGKKGKPKPQLWEPLEFLHAGPSGTVSSEGGGQPIDGRMDVDNLADGYHGVDMPGTSHTQISTWVAQQAPQLEQFWWYNQHTGISSSEDEPSGKESSDSVSLGSETSSELDNDLSDSENGVLTAWDLLAEDFEREAHSLG